MHIWFSLIEMDAYLFSLNSLNSLNKHSICIKLQKISPFMINCTLPCHLLCFQINRRHLDCCHPKQTDFDINYFSPLCFEN